MPETARINPCPTVSGSNNGVPGMATNKKTERNDSLIGPLRDRRGCPKGGCGDYTIADGVGNHNYSFIKRLTDVLNLLSD